VNEKILFPLKTIREFLVLIDNYCISRPRNRSLTYREKNYRRGRLRLRQDNLKDVKGFRDEGVHNIFSATENLLL
jgi:hypothetical protein